MRYKIAIILMSLVVLLLCFALWIFGSSPVSEFGLNAFTEASGIIFTILIIDSLMRKREEIKILPRKAAEYDDVCSLISKITMFWVDAYRNSIPGSSPSTIENLFSEKTFNDIFENLNLDADANTIPPTKWRVNISNLLSDYRKEAQAVLNRHLNTMDPEIYRCVHQMATAGMNPELILTLPVMLASSGYSVGNCLKTHFFIPEEYRNSAIRAYQWCENQEKVLNKKGVRDLRKLSSIPKWIENDSPAARI